MKTYIVTSNSLIQSPECVEHLAGELATYVAQRDDELVESHYQNQVLITDYTFKLLTEHKSSAAKEALRYLTSNRDKWCYNRASDKSISSEQESITWSQDDLASLGRNDVRVIVADSIEQIVYDGEILKIETVKEVNPHKVVSVSKDDIGVNWSQSISYDIEENEKGELPRFVRCENSLFDVGEDDEGTFISLIDSVNKYKPNGERGIKPKNFEQLLAMYALRDEDFDCVVMLGPAGTGKTLMALDYAMSRANVNHELKASHKIVICKPIVSIGKDLGFLPGSEQEKMDPWLRSYQDNMGIISPDSHKGPTKMSNWEMYLESGVIEVQPIHNIRGRSIENKTVIIDEAQNMTRHEMKTIVSRMGKNTKLILMGDPDQIDTRLVTKSTCGLVHAAMGLGHLDFVQVVELSECERSRLATAANRWL
jgi:phosphate starvation-inducible protein PhoH